jgi:NAD(P)-dependent dehydrogenase (short-subunit alcohol dehydrogenase family)
MKEFKDKVAVVAGAASGIGLAMAEKFAAEGMQVVMADIEPEALSISSEGLKRKGASILASRVDVRKPEEVEALAQKTVDTFGAVHVLCNNAGVEVIGAAWEHTLDDWEWVIGVNLWGVIHGVRAFVPRMLEQDSEAHIVNTASMAGLTTAPFMSVYDVTKFGVVALSESLYKDFLATGKKVRVSVLCPGLINTNIMTSSRNRPQDFSETGKFGEMAQQFRRNLAAGLAGGYPPSYVADMVFEGIRDEKFYIVPSQIKDGIKRRVEQVLAEENPTLG